MKRKIGVGFGILILLIIAVITVKQIELQEPYSEPTVNYWEVFEGIKKERRYIEEVQAYYRMPIFSKEQLMVEGEEITLKGYYLPNLSLDSVLVISRFNNANCFFCGQAGIESVVMVLLKEPRKRTFEIDQRLEVKGILTLNSSDVSKLAFVLEEADVIAY